MCRALKVSRGAVGTVGNQRPGGGCEYYRGCIRGRGAYRQILIFY